LIAQEHLTPEAGAGITKALGTTDMVSASTWLDEVRAAGQNRGEMKGDAEAKDFIHRFPGSTKWHFVNVPVGETSYNPNAQLYASKNDVAHAIALAVATLDGRQTGLSQSEAARVLIHCVGDISQPLHCITGYFDLSDPERPRLLSPSEVTAVSPGDAGGNALFFTKSEELHEYFDTVLLKKISSGTDYRTLAATAMRQYGAAHMETGGDFHHWPTVWASESVVLGTQAYEGIEFLRADVSRGQGHPALRLHKIMIRLPEGYAEREAPVMSRQIAEAGMRLADILNAIYR
jgi:hypothetical protein